MRSILIALVLAALALFAGCVIAIGHGDCDGNCAHWFGHSDVKQGSGIEATQTREVAEFHAIRIESNCDVEAKVGGERSLSVTTDDNLLEHLVTRVEDGVLVISTREGTLVSWRVRPRAVISAPALDALSIEGSGDAAIEGIAAESFRATISGSGDLRLAGRATKVDVSLSGSGDADASRLESQDASASISGSGDVRVWCTGNLSVSISGSGDVHYLGQPHTSVSISGSGDLLPMR